MILRAQAMKLRYALIIETILLAVLSAAQVWLRRANAEQRADLISLRRALNSEADGVNDLRDRRALDRETMIWTSYPLRHAWRFCTDCMAAQDRDGISVEGCACCDVDGSGSLTGEDLEYLIRHMREGFPKWAAAVRARGATVDQLLAVEQGWTDDYWRRMEVGE